MKKIIAAAMLVASFALVSASAKTKVTEEVRVKIIDHQKSATGGGLPDWVKATREGGTDKIAKKLDLDPKENHLFVIIGEGPNKEFLKTWTRQVNGVSQISQEFERVVAEVVQAEQGGASNGIDQASIDEKVSIYSAAMQNIVLNGLAKKAEYWVLQRTLAPEWSSWSKMEKALQKAKKKGGSTVNTNDYYLDQYVYYIVYAMDNDSYSRQLQAAMADVGDNSSESVLLKQSLTTKLQETLVPSRAIVDTPSED